MAIPYERPDHVLTAARNYGRQVEAELDAFIKARLEGRAPRFRDKACGVTASGRVDCKLHIDLNLWHYRLTANADPILIYQPLPHIFNMVAIVFHDEIFHGRACRWCHEWQEWIDWDGHEDKLDALNALFGPLADDYC